VSAARIKNVYLAEDFPPTEKLESSIVGENRVFLLDLNRKVLLRHAVLERQDVRMHTTDCLLSAETNIKTLSNEEKQLQ
jgi:hypothetical protein